jgi:hypothetical protein
MKSRLFVLFFLSVLAVSPVLVDADSQISIDNPNNSLVFGYVDMSDAPTKVSGAWLQQLSPPTDSPFWSMGIEKGLFYNPFIQPGTYQISKFAGSGFVAGAHEYYFPRQGRNQTAVTIEEPGIYFLGAYKYVKAKKGGMFKRARFSIEPISEPTEADLLRRILEDEMKIQKSKEYKGPRKIKIEQTVWADRIRAHLAEITHSTAVD